MIRLLPRKIKAIAKVAKQHITLPEPYLRLPFDPGRSGLAPVLSGYEYGEAEIAVHGVKGHGAIDWARPFGSPVHAAADGWAEATWDESRLLDDEGKPKLHDGQPMTFGQGLMIQIWHGKGRYTQYAHLSRLAEGRLAVPYYEPNEDESGNLITHETLRALVRDYQQPGVALKVKAGDLIGYVGLTGGAIGIRTYDRWCESDRGRRLREDSYDTYMRPHLHLVEFRRKRNKSRDAERRDPFGLYTTRDGYPVDVRQWNHKLPGQRHHPLWL